MNIEIATILVPTDFSAYADSAFDYALAFAGKFGARVELLHAYDLHGWVSLYEVTFSEEVERKIRATANRKVAALIEKATTAGVACEQHLALGTPGAVIIERAQAISADLIVMGTRGFGGAKRVLLGSVADRTIRNATCPVVTVGTSIHPNQ